MADVGLHMAETSGDTALGRMARSHSASSAPQVGVAAIWSRVLPRVAEEGLGLDLRATEILEEKVQLHEALGAVEEGRLLIALAAPGLPEGVAIVDAGLLTALIEVQTTGRVSSVKVEPRGATDTDHALTGHVLDRWLHEISEVSGNPTFRTGRRFPDLRAVLLSIDDGQATRISVHLDLGQGRRTGSLTLLHPRSDGARSGPDTERLRARLMPLGTEVEGVLCRVRLPLSQLSDLAVGDVVPLVGASVRQMTLEAPRGTVIVAGHLGQSGGFRAVRLRARAEAGAGPPALPRPGDVTLRAGSSEAGAPVPEDGAWSASDPVPDAGAPGLAPLPRIDGPPPL